MAEMRPSAAAAGRLTAWVLLLLASPEAIAQSTACNPNTQVCRTNTTLRGLTPFRGGVASARIEHYPVPRERGVRKGVMLWVYGFGLPKPSAACLNAGDTSAALAITDSAVQFPVRLGFDHYVVDFCNPTDFIQRNAEVVDRLISERIIPSLTATDKFGIMGNSMGGLVTRYLLMRRESSGRAHRANLWMTNDSPLKGAYIPLSIQLLGEVASSGGRLGGVDLGDLEEIVGLADTPAATQMLLAHHQGARGAGSPHREHELFFDELEVLGGFPRTADLRTVAISSGAPGNRATHPVSGLTWRIPVDRSLGFPIEVNLLGIVKWKSFIGFRFRGDVAVRMIPLTQREQYVIRIDLEGQWYINGQPAFRGNLEDHPPQNIIGFLADVLKVTSSIDAAIREAIGLPNVTSQAQAFSRALAGGVNALATVEAAYAYETLPGGTNAQYPDLAAGMKEISGAVAGGSVGTFIPTYSAIASTRAPTSSLVGTAASESPFDRFVVQSRDRAHVLSEADVACEETRRLAGVPYVSSVSPNVRVAGQGSFTMTVTGGNFTAQSIVVVGGTRVPTTFVNASRLTAEVSVNLIDQPTTTPIFADDPVPLAVPLTVSVNQYDAQGQLLANQHYSDQVGCRIGIVVQPSPIEFSPAQPTTENVITAIYPGVSNDSCIPQNPSVSRSGMEITVSAPRLSGVCLFALTPYEIRVNLGPLPAGEFRVTFRTGTTTLGQRSIVVTYPYPVITSIQPTSVNAGSSGFTLRVEGEKFVRGVSELYWKALRRNTTVEDSGELTAQITAADIASPGEAQITIRNAANRFSQTAEFTVLPAPPTITGVSPASVTEDTGPVLLRVTGTRFAAGASVVWLESGSPEPIPTNFVSATQLTAEIPVARLATPGTYPVAVTSGGLTSGAGYLVVNPAPVTPPPTPTATISGAGNGASFAPGVSRGSIATIFGTNIASSTISADRVPLPRTLGDTQVMVNGIAAPLFAVTPTQVNFQVPFEAPVGAAVPVWIVRNGVAGPQSAMLVTDNALGIFFYERAPGIRDPIITHADRSLVTPANPAHPGEVVVVWATGVGVLNNRPGTGATAPFNPPSVSTVTPVAILAGPSSGTFSRVLFAGLSPGSIGLIQVNVEIPSPRPLDANLMLGLRFPDQDQYLLVPIPVAAN